MCNQFGTDHSRGALAGTRSNSLIYHGGPIELFLVPAMEYAILWDVHIIYIIKDPWLLIEKSSPYGGSSRFPLLLSEWSFICPMPYNCKCVECILK